MVCVCCDFIEYPISMVITDQFAIIRSYVNMVLADRFSFSINQKSLSINKWCMMTNKNYIVFTQYIEECSRIHGSNVNFTARNIVQLTRRTAFAPVEFTNVSIFSIERMKTVFIYWITCWHVWYISPRYRIVSKSLVRMSIEHSRTNNANHLSWDSYLYSRTMSLLLWGKSETTMHSSLIIVCLLISRVVRFVNRLLCFIICSTYGGVLFANTGSFVDVICLLLFFILSTDISNLIANICSFNETIEVHYIQYIDT